MLNSSTNITPIKRWNGLLDREGGMGRFYDKYYLMDSISVGINQQGLVYCPTNYMLYLANASSNNVSVINPNTNTVVATITVGTSPYGVAYCPTNDRIYVVNKGADSVSVINPVTNTIFDTISLSTIFSQNEFIAYSSLNDKLYITSSFGDIIIIDPLTNTEDSSFTLSGGSAAGICYHPDGFMYVGGRGANKIFVIDVSTNTEVAAISALQDIRAIVYSPNNNKIYFSSYLINNIGIINAYTNTLEGYINDSGADKITTLIYVPSIDRIIGTSSTDDNLVVLNPQDSSIQTVPLLFTPRSIVYEPQNNKIYIVDTTNDELVQISFI